MSAPMNHKVTKSERKLMKKCNKSRSTLFRHEGIESINVPTKILCVSNGGLDNHVTQDEVLELFSCHGNVCDIIMLPRKPYAFVCFLNEEEAELAYTALNGYKLKATEDRKEEITLYISYVSRAPASIQPSTTLPPGLILLENFITDQYAMEIMASINSDTGCKDQERELKHRKVKHYGYEFKYSINNVDPDDPLPEGIPQVYKKLLDQALETGHVKYYPDQLTVNQYQPGQGIPPHVDTASAFEDGLMSLSIGSQVNIEFRHPDGRQLSILHPPNSLLIMTGESRYVWSHGITPRKYDIVPAADGGLTLSKRDVRTSFTFRKLTGLRPGQTVSKSEKPDVPISNSEAAELEKQHVYEVYEEIASHFSGTRHTPWPNIVEFLQQQEPGSMLADFGCGNGKYFGINKNLYEIGSDRSFNLVEICKERKFEVFVGDILSIPLRADVFDVCLCIAVIHHLATEERRLKAIQELMKILRVGGKALIYVWAMEQELNKVKSKYLKDSKSKSHSNGTNGQVSDKMSLGQCDNCSSSGESVDSSKDADKESICEGHKLDNTGQSCIASDKLSESVSDTSLSERRYKCKSESADTQNSNVMECGIVNDITERGNVKDITESGNVKDITKPGNVKDITECGNVKDIIECSNVKDITECGNVKDICTEHGDHLKADKMETNNNSRDKSDDYSDMNKENFRAFSTDAASSKEIDSDGAEGMTVEREAAHKTKLQVHVNRTKFKQQDLLVPWQLKGKNKAEVTNSPNSTYHRFYHVFKKGELESLCSKESSCKVIKSYYDQGNWAVILEKTE